MRIVRFALFGAITGLLCLASACARTPDQPMTTADFTFESSGQTLSGRIDLPPSGKAEALIIFVHGYGPTDIRGWDMYRELRTRFADIGIASVTWDKPGQGLSEGAFDINQPVAESAQEVLDAAAYLRASGVPGAENMGIWGISRAGWIAPIAMSQDNGFSFWISVSGTTAEDNFFYLVMSNLPYEGGSLAEAEALAAEWKRGFDVFRTGGSFDKYRAETANLWANEYISRMMNGGYSREAYETAQADYLAGRSDPPLDPETGMWIYVTGFDEMLSGLDVDVLALFGERDLNIDWRKVRALYGATIGENPDASLTVREFADANHNIDLAETGSLSEMETMSERVKADGYYDVQVEWLKENVLDLR